MENSKIENSKYRTDNRKVDLRITQCDNAGPQAQQIFKQRQMELKQSYKHCRRRRNQKVNEEDLYLIHMYKKEELTCMCRLKKLGANIRNIKENCMIKQNCSLKVSWPWAAKYVMHSVICIVLIAFTSMPLTVDAVTPASLPASVVLTSPKSEDNPPLSQQQRQQQQQNLFALLKIGGMAQQSQSTAASNKGLPFEPLKTKHFNHKRHRNKNDYDDDDGSESVDTDVYVGDLLKTSGYVSDDGQQYQKAEKVLGAVSLGMPGQQTHHPSCPRECKCLNDYFDCGKKHLDYVPTMPSYVQSIDFIGNKLNDSSVLQIRNLPELGKLVLKRNQLEFVPKFIGLPSLKQLSLSHNRIQNISSEALAALPNLKSLDLSKNYLYTFKSNSFPTSNRIAHLLLNGNKISSIDENAFENLSELLNLELNSNRLTILPTGVFKKLNKLRKLSLNFNQLEINWSTFRGLTAVQKLFLKANNIRLLQDGVFHVMRSIEMIDLDRNGISSLSRQGLFNLTKLHHLSLSNNSITRIELDTWEFTQSLVTLDLSHNNISEFKPQHLDCLQRLKHLNLAHNKIQYLMDNTFDCVKNLEDLNLRRNKLSWIIEDPGASPPFKSLRKLKKLDLYGNNLKQINTKSLMGLSSLEFLNLGSNALASVQSSAFDHMTHLQKLTFKSLNFICDCEILWFKQWLEKHFQASDQQQALCGYPEHLLDRQLLSLQQNELTCAESPKPKLLQEPINLLAVKESNITMECRATSPKAASFAATDELKIKWRHDNHNIWEQERNSQPTPQTSFTTTDTQIHNDPSNNQTTIIGYLRLYNISYEAAGKYQCMVSNAFGTTYSQKFKISIGIYPSFLQIPSNLTIDSGDSARLVCSATGNPTPEIALQKFGSSDFPAATERRLQVLRDENAFVITNAKPIDSGIYTCTAESPAGDIKVNASLFVNDKPQPDIPTIRKEIVVGKSSVLECLNDAAADLNQPHRDWYKDSKPFHITPTLDSERYFFTPEKELLVIVNTQSVDAGRYRCEITDGSKTFTMLMDLIVVKEDFSQNVIIIGVAVVTVACIIVGSLIVWIILFYQKKKLNLNGGLVCNVNGGSRIATAHSHNILTCSRANALDQTEITTLNRTYLRSPPRDHYHQRPRSLAALEVCPGLYPPDVDEHQPLTEQRSCLIVTTTPNYQQMLLQRNNPNKPNQGQVDDMNDDGHLTLEYLGLNSSQDVDQQQDHLSSKDSGTGSDAANKRSLEDFCVTLIPSASTPNSTATLKSRGQVSLSKQDTDDDENYNDISTHVNESKSSFQLVESPAKLRSTGDRKTKISPSTDEEGAIYALTDLSVNNNQLDASQDVNLSDQAEKYQESDFRTSTFKENSPSSSHMAQTVDI